MREGSMRLAKITCAAVASLALACAAAADDKPAPRPAPPTSQHLLVEVAKDGDTFRVVRTTVVPSALPKRRDKTRVFPWRCALIAMDGAVLHEVGLADPTELRGEFHNADDPSRIDAVHVRQPEPVHFTVRLPKLTAARIDFFALQPELRRAAKVTAKDYVQLGSAALPEAGKSP